MCLCTLRAMTHSLSAGSWEFLYAPYDQGTYQEVLKNISSADVVLDIGAGDLRLARRMAQIARRVYTIEISVELFMRARLVQPLPENLIPVGADARTWDFPSDVNVGVLLMRHCTHYQLYANKLMAIGAQKLITNARWRMGVEVISLRNPGLDFNDFEIGWYACACGAASFKSGPVEKLTPASEAMVHEVINCPNCLDFPSKF